MRTGTLSVRRLNRRTLMSLDRTWLDSLQCAVGLKGGNVHKQHCSGVEVGWGPRLGAP